MASIYAPDWNNNMVKIKRFHFPSLGITLHDITGIEETKWANGEFTHLGLRHGQDRLFETSEVNEDTAREYKRLKLVLQVAHGSAKAQRSSGPVLDSYDPVNNTLVNGKGEEWSVDNFACPLGRYEEPQWITIRTLEDALPWLGATVEHRYVGISPSTAEGRFIAVHQTIEDVGAEAGISLCFEGCRPRLTSDIDANPIQVRGERHPNSLEIVRKWRELHDLIGGSK